MQKQMRRSVAVTVKLISAFVFATQIIQFLFFLNLKFQASSLLLWLYMSVVRVGFVSDLIGTPEDWFSRIMAHMILIN